MTTPPAPSAPPARQPSGFERRTGVPRWVAAVAAVAVVVAGIAGGVLAVIITATHPHPHTDGDASLTADQAKTQACNAFTLSSRQWVEAYRQWLPIVSTPGWQWSNRAVQDATTRFSEQEGYIVTQLESLIPANTPTEVAQSIRGYTSALLEYSAGHGSSTQVQMDQQENTIDDASDDVNAVCAEGN